MLINLSNHPSNKWSTKQLETAITLYKVVTDIPFPHIDPSASLDEVSMLVDDYISKVKAMPPATIHIMGELTFTHIFVRECERIGIMCIAATTNRMVEEVEGRKVVTFDFVQFRSYF